MRPYLAAGQAAGRRTLLKRYDLRLHGYVWPLRLAV